MDNLMSVGISSGLRVWAYESARSQNLQPFQADVLRTVCVRMGRVAALLAGEFRPAFPVGPLRVAALTASLGRVTRVNKKNGNTRPPRQLISFAPQINDGRLRTPGNRNHW